MSNDDPILENAQAVLAISDALSEPRMETYHQRQRTTSKEDPAALTLYLWNARVASAMFLPLHLLEVVIRNAISEAITKALDNPEWPFVEGFSMRLPNKQRRELRLLVERHDTVNKIIPELKFSFWESMLTRRHDDRIWNRYFWATFPHSDKTRSVSESRQAIHSDLEYLRRLRNRIAHHEPIFTRHLDTDYQLIYNLIELRCNETASWMDSHQDVSDVLALRPDIPR